MPVEQNGLVQCEVSIREVASAPELFPGRRVSARMAAERLLLQAVLGLSSRGVPTRDVRGKHRSTSARSTTLVRLPAWKPRYRQFAKARLNFEVDTSAPAKYYVAQSQLVPDLAVEWKIIVRPSKGYVMLGGLMTLKTAAQEPGVTRGYDLRFDSIQPDETPDLAMQRILKTAVEDLASNKSSPMSPTISVSGPALKDFQLNIENDALVFGQELPSGKITITQDPDKCAKFPEELKRLAGDLVTMASGGLELRPGITERYSAQTVLDVYNELVPACSRILSSLSSKTWPPFRNAAAARLYLSERCHGSGEVREALVALLCHGTRRPGKGVLAIRVLEQLAGLTRTRLRQIIRK